MDYYVKVESLCQALHPLGLSSGTPVEATNDNMNLHPLVRDSVKVTNLTLSMESFMPKVVQARLFSELLSPRNN
ncbi:hypothetical protein ACTXT7_010502 [Hymenolepis weldensis]